MLPCCRRLLVPLAAWACCLIASAAFGADATPDKSQYGVLSPTPDDALRDFSPDRPARASSPYTVDAGRFQIESDFLNYSFADQDGTRTRTFLTADPVLKLGITQSVDFEVTLGGYNDIRSVDHATGMTVSRARGYGDTTFTAKINILGNDGGDVAFAVAPYLIAPTGARGITAGQVEGGVIAPVTLKLPSDFLLTLQTEIDALANENGPGTHVNFTNIVNVSHEVPGIKDLTAFAELYSSLDTEAHTPDIYTFDVALAYLTDKNTQLDMGANIGLNRGAPGYQIYSGVTHRF